MATPAWIGASTGQPPLSAQINQFLGTHAATMVYTGAQQDHQASAGSGAANSNGLYIAQSVTAGSSYTGGRVVLTLAVTGTPTPWSLSIQSNSGAAPSGTVLGGPVSLPPGFVTGSAAAVSIPVSAALTNGTKYWIVANAAGDAGDFFAWSKSNQASGASTSTNGVTWAAQTYGLLFQVWDNTLVQPLVHTLEDSGARWTTWAFTTQSAPSKLSEYTVSQAAADYVQSVRSFGYTNGLLTSVT